MHKVNGKASVKVSGVCVCVCVCMCVCVCVCVTSQVCSRYRPAILLQLPHLIVLPFLAGFGSGARHPLGALFFT